MSAIRALLDGLIDYAGFAPPASLPMAAAVRNYASYRDGAYSWALGRLVIPADRIAEFEQAARGLPPFNLSILLPPRISLPASANHCIDAVEARAENSADIIETLRRLPREIAAYFEIPAAPLVADLLEPIARLGARAKIRTGGLTAAAFPSSIGLVDFISAASRARVPFKATAGLHHPIRGVHKLTYEMDSPCGIMHGFLNVFLASALLYSGGSRQSAVRTLEEQSAEAFHFDDAGVSWHDHRLSVGDITNARKHFAMSFGSCSFEEPIADLQALGFL